MKAKSDFIFLGLLCLLVQYTIFRLVYTGYIGSLNNYLAFCCLAVVLLLRLVNNRFGRRSVGWLILLGTFNIVSFTIGSPSISFGLFVSNIQVDSPGIDIFMLLLLTGYYFTNKKAIHRIIKRTLYGSSEEQLRDRQKRSDHYLQLFVNDSAEELNEKLKYFEDYPIEAQIALTQLLSKHPKSPNSGL